MNTAIANKATLMQELYSNRNQIKSFGVKQLGLFGSFVTGKVQSNSDVDLLVEFEEGKKSYDNFMALSFYLEELLGRDVELVTSKSLSKYIGPYILKQVENVSL